MKVATAANLGVVIPSMGFGKEDGFMEFPVIVEERTFA